MEIPIEKPHKQAKPLKFDKLNYVKKLRATQLTQQQAEVIAEGTGDLGDSVIEQIMHAIDQRDFATVKDLELQRVAFTGEFTLVRQEAIATKESLIAKTDSIEQRLDAKIDGVEQRLNAKIDNLGQRLDAKIDGVEHKLLAEMSQHKHDNLKNLIWTAAILGFTIITSLGSFLGYSLRNIHG